MTSVNLGASRSSALALFRLGLVIVLVSLGAIAPVHAQSAGVNARINQLQSDLNYLGGLITELQTVVRQERGARSAASNVEARIGALETEMRNMTGSLERLSFEVEQMRQQNDQLRDSVSFQLREFETLLSAQSVGGANANISASASGSSNQAASLGFQSVGSPLTATVLPDTTVVPEAQGFDPYIATGAGGTEGPTERTGPAAERYNSAYQLYAQGAYSAAAAAFQQFLETDALDPLASNASYWLGESLYAQNDYTAAAIQFASGFRSYAETGKGPDHLYKLALTLAQLDRLSEACGSLALLTSRYSASRPQITERARAQSAAFGCGG